MTAPGAAAAKLPSRLAGAFLTRMSLFAPDGSSSKCRCISERYLPRVCTEATKGDHTCERAMSHRGVGGS